MLLHFHYKYREHVLFRLKENVPGHYNLVLESADSAVDGWQHVDVLANSSKSHCRVGGDGDKSDVKTLDGTNYQQWAPKMEAYLKSKELWYYVSGITP
jgi:hypothetical protein